VKKKLSVRETEALVRRMLAHADASSREVAEASKSARGDPNIRKLESELTDRLGAKVRLQHGTSGKGKVVIDYTSLDELDGILQHLRGTD